MAAVPPTKKQKQFGDAPMNGSLSPSSPRRALVWMAPCIAAWSLIPLLASHTGGLDSHQYLFASSSVSAVTLALCAAVAERGRQRRRHFTSADLARLTALAALGAFGYYALLYAAYAPCPHPCGSDKPLIIIVAQYTWPAFAVVWSAILLRDRVNVRIFLSLAIGILAVWVGAHTGAPSSFAAAKLPFVLLAAAMFGLYSVLMKKFDYEPLPSLAWTFGAATLMAWVAMMVMSAPIQRLDPTAIRSVVINGTVVNGLSYVWWQRALRAAPVTFVAPWITLIPLLAAVFTADPSTAGAPFSGIALVLVSVLLATVPVRRTGRDGAMGPSPDSTAVKV
jgi:drug/metabolite transporter (DMT)-like permease